MKKAPVHKNDVKKVDYFIPNSKPTEEQLKESAQVREDKMKNDTLLLEDQIERKLSETEGYNKEISNSLPDLSDFDLMGNYLLIRPFKIEVVEKTESGIITMSKTTETYTDDRTNKTKVKEMAYPYQHKGIVVKHGIDIDNTSKERFPVGSLVAFLPFLMQQFQFCVNINDEYEPYPEKYFTAKVPCSQIERVYKENKYDNKHSN
jgi:hypothetical protein